MKQGYIYKADIYCMDCGDAIVADLMVEEEQTNSGDSNDWPQAVDVSGEADSPQHCGNGGGCLNAEELTFACGQPSFKIGCWLENSLTDCGLDYVKRVAATDDGPVAKFWAECYLA